MNSKQRRHQQRLSKRYDAPASVPPVLPAIPVIDCGTFDDAANQASAFPVAILDCGTFDSAPTVGIVPPAPLAPFPPCASAILRGLLLARGER